MSDDLFIKCKICNCVFTNIWKLSYHLKSHNISREEYYKKYISQDINCGLCKECGKATKFISLGAGFKIFCSLKCSHNNIETKQKKEKTYLKHFGVTHNFKSKETREKIEKTSLKKYGVKNPSQSEEIKQKIKNIFLDKYGIDSYMKTDDFKKKSKETCKELYNNENYTNREKYKETCLEKYGCKTTLELKENKLKARQTCLEKYGVEYPLQNEIIKEKVKLTSIKNHNGIGFAATDLVKRYFYDNKYFDSSWELAYYIWLKDNNIEFEYHPNIYFEYIDTNNIKRKYFPDFKVNNDFIEIKGDFLIEENIFKMDNNKFNCIKENVKEILFHNDIIKYLNYINEKYGKNYLKTFIVKKN